jgi:Spy/CpxP family protein refolding chaperone
MFGFIIGLGCLWGLCRVVRGGRGYRGGCGGRSRWGGRWRHSEDEGRHHFFLRRMFQGLDTTPGQEKEIKRAADEVIEAAHALKDDLNDTRGDVGRAFKSDVFDEDTMADLLTRNDEKLDELRKAFVGSLARVHETLDSDQRAQLARILQRGPRWGGGPFRNYA